MDARHDSFTDMLEALPEGFPLPIHLLWGNENALVSRDYEVANMDHQFIETLAVWASTSSIEHLLQSRVKCSELINEMSRATLELGFLARQLNEIPHSSNRRPVYISPCLGCNTCWDNGGCEHRNMPPRRRLNPQGLHWERNAMICLHRSVKLLALICKLLASPESNSLTQLIVNEPPSGIDPLTRVPTRTRDDEISPLITLVILMGKCSGPFPTAAHVVASTLSLVVSRRPSVALAMLDPAAFAHALHQYMADSIFHLVSNSECRVEEYFGVVAFINLLPLLYFLGDWKEGHEVLPRHDLPSFVATLAINILHSAADDDAWDSPPDTDNLPELNAAHVRVRPLFQSTDIAATVLREHPMSFCVAASIEVLGRWANKRVPVGSAEIPVARGPPATVASSLQEYKSQLEILMTRTPAIAPLVRPIVSDIVNGDRPPLPAPGTSLLHEPLLRASQYCALASCNRTECEGGERLRRCTGGCGGLARYCCKEHQQTHWGQHKYFCKRQASAQKRNTGGATR